MNWNDSELGQLDAIVKRITGREMTKEQLFTVRRFIIDCDYILHGDKHE